MKAILGVIGYLLLIGASVCGLFFLMGEDEYLPYVPDFFLSGIVFLALSMILERVRTTEALVRMICKATTDRITTEVGDFERLGNVEGQAMCLGCRKVVPKEGLYYSKSLDVYYHAECLAKDSERPRRSPDKA